jgi:hypothetical protein
MKSTLVVFIAAFCVIAGMRCSGGAFVSELGGHPDEAAHFVTGLMMHDYVAGGFLGSPMRFAQAYYAHYPKIGLGVWPPLFYLVQTAWTLVLPATSASVLVLVCALAAAVAALLFYEASRRHGVFAGTVAAAAFAVLPLVQEYSGMVMAEMLCALLMFGAVVAFERFLQFNTKRWAALFGVLAALAILTKGTGLALALVPVLVAQLTRKWRILVSPALWTAALIVLVVAGPWTWMTRDMGHGGWEYSHPTWLFTKEAVPYYLTKLHLSLGTALLVFLVAGSLFVWRGGESAEGGLRAHLALLLSVLIFQSIMPVGYEARHLIAALPSAILLACEGAALMAGWLSRSSTTPLAAKVSVFGLLAAVFGLTTFHMVEKHESGFREIALRVAGGSLTGGKPVLVSSDARGEGMFIAEVAQNEHRPGGTITRASKALSKSEWSGRSYQPLFSDEKEMLAFLTGGRFSLVVADDSMPPAKRLMHHELLRRTLLSHPERFQPLARSTVCRDGRQYPNALTAYRIVSKP